MHIVNIPIMFQSNLVTENKKGRKNSIDIILTIIFTLICALKYFKNIISLYVSISVYFLSSNYSIF